MVREVDVLTSVMSTRFMGVGDLRTIFSIGTIVRFCVQCQFLLLHDPAATSLLGIRVVCVDSRVVYVIPGWVLIEPAPVVVVVVPRPVNLAASELAWWSKSLLDVE